VRYLKHCLIYASGLAICGTAYIVTAQHPFQGKLPVAAEAPAPPSAAVEVAVPTVFDQNRQLEQNSKDRSVNPAQTSPPETLPSRSESLNAVAQQDQPQRMQATAPVTAKPHRTAESAATEPSSDLLWLARAIEAEAGGEPYPTKIAVGDVILNRVRSPLYPDTIHDVLFQVVSGKYAFTCVQNGWIYHTPSAASWEAARAVLYRRENIVPDALVFYTNSKTPADSWVRTRPVVKVMGDMYFAR
jgi:spore germination cell wall hydrolase CwlJ-like protein